MITPTDKHWLNNKYAVSYEEYNMGLLNALIACNNPEIVKPNERATKKKKFHGTELEQLIKLQQRLTVSKKNSQVGYQLVKYERKNDKIARFYPDKYGYTLMRRELRALLCQNKYFDLDIAGALPSILSQVCEHFKIPCKLLKQYANDRECFHQIFMNDFKIERGGAKDVFIGIINGSSIETICKEILNVNQANVDLSHLEKFYQECKIIRKSIVANHASWNIQPNEEKKTDAEAIERSIFAKINHTYEAEIMGNVLMYLRNKTKFIGEHKQRSNFVYIFDGCLLPISEELNCDDLVEELQIHIKQKCKLNVSFKIKPFETNQEHLNILIPLSVTAPVTEQRTYTDIIIRDDKQGADIIINELRENKNFVKCNGRFFRRRHFGIYEELMADKDIVAGLSAIIQTKNLCMAPVKAGSAPRAYGNNDAGSKHIANCVLNHIEDLRGEFTTKLLASQKGILCFQNGYYNLVNKEFINWEINDDEIITTSIITKDYCEPCEESKALALDLLKSFIPRDDLRKYVLYVLICAIGCFKMKMVLLGEGLRNSGKGVLTEWLKYTFGEQYITSFCGNNILGKRAGGDSEKDLGWALNGASSRLCISNELSTQDEKGNPLIVDGNIIKRISSGGDEISARKLFGNIVKVVPTCTYMILLNETPVVKPEDAYQSIVTLPFECEFKNKLTPEDLEINKRKGLDCIKIADPDVKNKISTNEETREKLQYGFMHLLIDAYKAKPEEIPQTPECVITTKNTIQDDNVGLETKLKELFCLNEGTTIEDKMTTAEIDAILKDEGFKNTRAKAPVFRKYGIEPYRSSEVRGWLNIKVRPKNSAKIT